MNQTRVFLIFAWLMVATLLWMEWGKERAAPVPSADAITAMPASASSGTVPSVSGETLPAVPANPATTMPAVPAMGATTQPVTAQTVTVTTDVLRLVLDGGAIRSAELLGFPQTTARKSAPVKLLDDSPARFFSAQSGWVSQGGAAPNHESGFVPELPARAYAMVRGGRGIDVPFIWRGPEGVTIRRVYSLKRNEYTITVRDEVINAGAAPWQGYVYRQLLRNPPPSKSGLTNPEAYSFTGAAWYSPEEKYEKRKYDDFADDGTLDRQVKGGWIALLQHYFFAAWIPSANDATTFSLATPPANGGTQYLIRELGPGVNVAPGTRASSEATLWVGPKLQDRLDDVAPGLALSLDYGMFTFLAKPIAWLLGQLHQFTHNWGWAIVLLVLLIKLALYPLSAAQYKSMAKMRKFQPRIAQLKERYGEDKQKFQMAMMELYKKEKINPVGGCLPVLLQMPIFLALYWVLLESVELRQAPWILWIQDLTARDPFFILPVLNAAVMWATQKLSPAVGMDPMQQKMMQMMPLVFGVMFAFFPAGLVLYWVTNGSLGLLQQWWMTRKYSEAPAKASP
ncbi:MAG: membrane protein insertase YidC, partial [Pseudomonadota bacterium]|nr:membrane protein insertase YidC [Pseudomonadota bacterium]